MRFERAKRVTGILLALFLAFSMLPGAQAVYAAKGDTEIVILHTNDTHGRVYQVDSSNTGMIGLDKIAAIKKATPNAILVDVGDTIHGLPIVNINKGENAVKLMTLAGYDVMTPGNHDFNFGSERLVELADTYDLSIISANIVNKDDGANLFPANKIVEVDGVKVGFFGLTTTDTQIMTNPVNVSTIEFLDYLAQAEAAIADLQDQGAQVIVMLAHVSRDDIKEFLPELTVMPDIVIDGHDHRDTNEEYEGVLIAGSGEHEKNLGKITVVVGKDGNVSAKAELIPQADTAQTGMLRTVRAAAEVMKAEFLEVYDVVVAESDVALSSARGSVSEDGVVTDGVRNSESALGNLVADAIREAAGSDVALTNGGGLRADIKVGDVKKSDINAVLPFGNYIVVKEIYPAQLKEALEVGLAAAPAPAGAFPQISGMRIVYDPDAEAGNKVLSINVNGEELDLTDDSENALTIATNDFMAVGGDGYSIFAGLTTVFELEALDVVFEDYIVSLPDATITEEYASMEGRIITIGEYIEAVEEDEAA